jgi:hypothetical protein
MDVEEIKRRVAICDLIESCGLTVVGNGRMLRTKEHDSLCIWPAKNDWCWYSQPSISRPGKAAGGSVIDWVMFWEHCDERTAIRMLEQRAELSPFRILTAAAPVRPPDPLPADLHLRCHAALTPADRAWHYDRGFADDDIAAYQFGVYQHQTYGRCYTIPIIEGGALANLRLRLAAPANPKDKYRPYDIGRGTHLFNRDIIAAAPGLVIVAGEYKAALLTRHGVPTISSTGGCGTWQDAWTPLVAGKPLWLAFDPGEERAAERLADLLGGDTRVVHLPKKPDDLVSAQGIAALRYFLQQARPLGVWRKTVSIPVSAALACALAPSPRTQQPTPSVRVPWRKQLLAAPAGGIA